MKQDNTHDKEYTNKNKSLFWRALKLITFAYMYMHF